MSYWRVSSKARSARVRLEGLFSGFSAFLIGGSPRIGELERRHFNMPGCWSMAINNAATVVEPQAFIALDPPSRFSPLIFRNTRVLKLLNYTRAFDEIDGRRVCSYPNTLFFDIADETKMKMSEFCSLEGPLPFWGMTFFTAIACLYQLGFKQVYLAGCTFDRSGYSHSEQDPISAGQNAYVLGETVDQLKILMPMLKDEGMQVNTVHKNTPLDGICEYTQFEDAVSEMSIHSNANHIQNEAQLAFFISQVLTTILMARNVAVVNKTEEIGRFFEKNGIKVTSEFSRSVFSGDRSPFESGRPDAYIMHDIFAEMQIAEIEKALSVIDSLRKPLIFTISTLESEKRQPVFQMTRLKWKETLSQLGSAVILAQTPQYNVYVVLP